MCIGVTPSVLDDPSPHRPIRALGLAHVNQPVIIWILVIVSGFVMSCSGFLTEGTVGGSELKKVRSLSVSPLSWARRPMNVSVNLSTG